MCGLVGFIGGEWADGKEQAAGQVRAMAAQIQHRGPDGTGNWTDPERRVALGHNRLAILDLSPAGDQPMVSSSGRFVIVYNGEIYNHEDLRRRLISEGAGANWRGHSDTETLLAAIEAWGVRATLERCVGMFGLALWDRQDQVLTLVRDRLGEKPLYYGWQGEGRGRTFFFGSELKAFAVHPAFRGEIDRQALTLYMRHAYVPAPFSIYRGIKKLLPGSYLTYHVPSEALQVEQYWSGAEAARKGAAMPLGGSEQEHVDALEQLLSSAVKNQMLSDVPLGAFLSGGVDSSTIVALMQRQSPRPVRTFTIGFHEEGYNEAEHAKAVARHLGTDHTEIYVTPQEAMAAVPALPSIYDEPFGDSSQIPTLLVSRLARRDVTVALSGDGGDELFAGYNRYLITDAYWRKLSRIPRPLRSGLARGMGAVSPDRWNKLAAAVEPLLPQAARMKLPGEKIIKGAGVLGSGSAKELYHGLISIWQDPASVVVDGNEAEDAVFGDSAELSGLSDIERMMVLDMLGYLPDDILVKVDRAAMSTSLETRVPLLDHRVVEFAWSLPMGSKLRSPQTKWALRQVLYRHVPPELIERPKAGFGVPIEAWLRGPLREWAEELLDERRLREEGYLDPGPVRRMWSEHLSGRSNRQHQLWTVLMFQSWLEFVKNGSAAASAEAFTADSVGSRVSAG